MSPAAFEQALRIHGNRFDPSVLQTTRDLYKPHIDLSPAGEEQVDVAYGPHERHRLDVYHAASAPRAVVVFVHGGGFVAGSKNGDGVFYANIGRWLARQGYTAVLPNYRLAPAHPWPAGAEDVGRALDWVREQLMGDGGARLPLVLWGQSAGANHVATWLYDPRQAGRAQATSLSAVLLMSGLYEVQAPLPAGPLAYFGEDASQHADRCVLNHVVPLDLPIWLSLAELDPDWIAPHTYALARAITVAQGRSPAFHYFCGHNHVSTVQSLGSPHTSAGQVLADVLSQARPR